MPSHRHVINIAGSSTILPLSETWAASFTKKYNILVSVQGGGSTNGVNLLKKHQTDIAACSRNLSPSESTGLTPITIAKDVIVVIVNKHNPVSDLSTEQLRKIFAGEIRNWRDVGGPDHNIEIINRESGSGTRSSFEELVMCSNTGTDSRCSHMSLSAMVLNSNAEVKRSIESIEYGIAYVSFGFLDERVKALSLNHVDITKPENIDKYPISRNLLYLVSTDQSEDKNIKLFLQFIRSETAQRELISEGFLPVHRP